MTQQNEDDAENEGPCPQYATKKNHRQRMQKMDNNIANKPNVSKALTKIFLAQKEQIPRRSFRRETNQNLRQNQRPSKA
jgi:hypothetical protein